MAWLIKCRCCCYAICIAVKPRRKKRSRSRSAARRFLPTQWAAEYSSMTLAGILPRLLTLMP